MPLPVLLGQAAACAPGPSPGSARCTQRLATLEAVELDSSCFVAEAGRPVCRAARARSCCTRAPASRPTPSCTARSTLAAARQRQPLRHARRRSQGHHDRRGHAHRHARVAVRLRSRHRVRPRRSARSRCARSASWSGKRRVDRRAGHASPTACDRRSRGRRRGRRRDARRRVVDRGGRSTCCRAVFEALRGALSAPGRRSAEPLAPTPGCCDPDRAVRCRGW